MKILLLVTLLLFSTLNAGKVLYLSNIETPQRVIKGEIFSITIKTISTVQDFSEIQYSFKNSQGLKSLNSIPERDIKGKYYFETFHFLTTQNRAKLPDITASLVSNEEYDSTTILGDKLNVITLNPKKDYSNIIANSFELTEYKTTSFDIKHNIIVFTAKANNSDLKKINFQNVFKQGIESLKESYFEPRLTYFVVVNKDLEQFSFSYFNLNKNRFIKVTIPIVVDDDSVTTQTDLKPKDQSKVKLKMSVAGVLVLLILLIALWRRKYIYLFLVLIPIGYIVYIGIPSKDICIKQGSNIYLLPVSNGTIFETTETKYTLPKEGSVKNFVKVKLKNQKIGWVKNEDICSF